MLFRSHPFREPFVPRNPEFLDGVEYNQRPNSGNNNGLLEEWLKDYPYLKLVSGSDCHSLKQVGFGGIEIQQAIRDIKELAAIMKREQVRLIKWERLWN